MGKVTNLSPKKKANITPEQLLEDNRSPKADAGRQEWEDARRKGKLTGVRACADARVLIPHAGTLRVRTIATGGPEQEYTMIFADPDIDKIVILAHYAGNRVEKGKPPEGCGGIHAKQEALSDDAWGRFVGEHIVSTDVLIQAWVSAATTARRTRKPTLAAVQDHLDGKILPVAAFLEGGGEVITAIPIEHMLHKQYHPERIYAQGIPVLPGRKVPEIFDEFLDAGRDLMIKTHDEYPNLEVMQQIQNPETIVISTEARPLQICFPDTFKKPGSVFKISIPRNQIDITIPIADDHIAIALAQVQFAIVNSVTNHDQQGSSFSNTKTIFIETGNFALSTRLANDLLAEPLVQQWIKLPERQIIIAQMREGIAHRIEKINSSK